MSGLLCVAPHLVDKIWPQVEHMIDAAFEALDEPTPDVRKWLIEKHGLLWVYFDGPRLVAGCTTSLVHGRRGLMCRIVAIGGSELALWKDSVAEIERYARAEGCYKVAFDGRGGWKRFLQGYGPKCVSFEKLL